MGSIDLGESNLLHNFKIAVIETIAGAEWASQVAAPENADQFKATIDAAIHNYMHSIIHELKAKNEKVVNLLRPHACVQVYNQTFFGQYQSDSASDVFLSWMDCELTLGNKFSVTYDTALVES